MNVGPRVRIRRYRSDGEASCEEVDCKALPRRATRERVRQHVIRTGHRARFVIRDLTVYEPLGRDSGNA